MEFSFLAQKISASPFDFSSKLKKKIRSSAVNFALKVLCLSFAILSLTCALYPISLIIGLLNYRSFAIRSIFFCYAGNKKYAEHYLFEFYQNWGLGWIPIPIGILHQGGYWGIAFGSSITEEEFTNSKNADDLDRLIRRLKTIARLLNVQKVSLAGILPSYLERSGRGFGLLSDSKPAHVVCTSYQQLCKAEFKGKKVPTILLGGNGSVGKHIQRIFDEDNVQYYVVDPNGGLNSIPENLRGKKAILIDVARKGVLSKHLESLWNEIIILNETFPEPPKDILLKLKAKRIRVYHLAGVVGGIYPSLPHGYSKSVPCCAIHDNLATARPVIREIRV